MNSVAGKLRLLAARNGHLRAGGFMFLKGKLAKVLLALTLIVLPVKTPREIEDLLHVMNETRVEVSIPEQNGNGDTK